MAGSPSIRTARGADWDLLAERWGATLFSRSSWGEVWREGLGARPVFLVLQDPSGTPLSGMAGVILGRLGLRLYHSMFPYGGPMGEEALFPEMVRRGEKALKAMGVHSVRITLPPDRGANLPGYRVTTLPQHSVALCREEPTSTYGSHARRDVRRSIKAGARVERLRGPEGVGEFYRLYLQSMRRNRAPAKLPLSFFRAIESRLGPAEEAAFHATIVGGRPASAVCMIYTGGIAHALSQGSDLSFQRFRPTDLLVHQCIADAAARGMKGFDFMASPVGDASLRKYKEKWGAREGQTVTLDRHLHPVLGPALGLARRLVQVPILAGATRAFRRYAS